MGSYLFLPYYSNNSNISSFVAHPIVSAYIDRAWYGRLSPRQNNLVLWLNIFFFWTVWPITLLAQYTSAGVEFTTSCPKHEHFIGKSIVTRGHYDYDYNHKFKKVKDLYRNYKAFFTAPIIKFRQVPPTTSISLSLAIYIVHCRYVHVIYTRHRRDGIFLFCTACTGRDRISK